MANSYKDIIITPNRSNTADPSISFRGGNTSSNTEVTLRVYPESNGTISFEGSAGQLFSVTNDLTGSIFSVNDVSGIPSIEVFANGLISLAPYNGTVNIGGNVAFSGNSSISAQVFYDSANTSFYLDPATGSNLNGTLVNNGGTAMSGGWNRNMMLSSTYPVLVFNSSNTKYSGIGVDHSSSSAGFYFWVNSGSADVSGSGTGAMYIDTGNFVNASGSFRAPIFYDNGNTSFYVDPGSTSTSLNIAGGMTTTAASGSILLKHAVSEADAWIFQENASNWGLYWKNSGSPSAVFGGYTTIGAELIGTKDSGATNSVSISSFTGCNAGTNATWMLSNYEGYFWTAGIQFSAASMRSPIFYDSANTSFYVDPASTSVLNILNIPGQQAINTTTPGTTSYNLNFIGQSVADNAQAITWSWATSGAAQAGIYVQSSGGYGTKMYLATTDSFATGSKTAISIDHSGITNFVRATPTVTGNAIWHAGNDGSGSGLDADLLDGSGWTSGQNVSFGEIRGTDGAFGNQGVLASGYPLTVYDSQRYLIGLRNSAADVSHPWIVHDDWNGAALIFHFNGIADRFRFSEGGIGQADADWRAPIFYDSSNTSFYVDPASTSNLSALNVGGSGVWTSGNDGSGSGLDADLLDGVNSTDVMLYRGSLAGTSVDNGTSNGFYTLTNPGDSDGLLVFNSGGSLGPFQLYAKYSGDFRWRNKTDSSSWSSWRTIWHSGNDGSGSGLDADLLDGQHGSYYAAASSLSSYLPLSGGTLTGTLTGVSGAALSFNAGTTTASSYNYVLAAGNDSGNRLVIFVNGTTRSDDGGTNATTIRNDGGALNLGSASYSTNLIGSSINASGNAIWHAGNDGSGSGLDADLLDGISSGSFLRNDTTNLVTTFSNRTRWYSANVLDSASADQASLEVFNGTAGEDAFMTFHVGGDFAAYFGLAGDVNDFCVGGWSMGATKYRVWHSGNDGSGSGLDADLLDGVDSSGFARARTRSNWNDSTVISNVIGQLAWKHYGNNHTIFDASNSTAPDGTSVNNTNAAVAWGATYPTLMGWNGSSTYGVRVDSARVADSATTADQIDSWAFRNTGSNSGTAADSLDSNGITYVASNISLYGQTDGALYSQAYSSSWQHQIYGDYRTGQIAIRGKNSGTWQSWRTVWDSSNDGSGSGLDADLLDGYNSSAFLRYYGGTFAGDWQTLTDSAGELRVDQVANINGGAYSNQPPNVYTYGGVLSWRTDNHSFQLYASHTGDLTFKTQWNNDNYSGWRRILHESNIGSFAWTSSNDGSGSGLDADTLDGVDSSGYWTKSGGWYGSGLPGSRLQGISASGGEFVLGDGLPNAGQIGVLIDGAYVAGENNGFWSLASDNTWGSRRGFTWDGSAVNFTTNSPRVRVSSIDLNYSGYYMTQGDWGWRHVTPDGWIQFGPANSSYAHIYTDRGNFYFNVSTLYANGSTMWHAGNDGSGSGLDADLLDGYSSSSFSGPNSTIKQFFWNGLTASGTQARRFEIARLAVDYNDWNTGIGAFEVELWERYYSRGLKKKYVVYWGYTNTYGINLVEYVGSGDNNFQCTIGTPVLQSGDNYYLPVYVDVNYYSHVDVRVTTNRDITGSSSPGIGQTYINLSPSPTNISSFSPDSTVNFTSTSSVQINGNTLWHAGNDGAGSGLDADLWDGYQFADYLNQAVKTNSTPTFYQAKFTQRIAVGNGTDPYLNTGTAGIWFSNGGGASHFVGSHDSDNSWWGIYTNGAWRAYLNGSGHWVVGGDVRAPIFYDSANTSFYVDPASTSNINQLNGNGKVVFETTDSYLRINQSSGFSSGVWFGTSNILVSSGYIAAGSNGGTTTSRVYINSGTYNGTNVISLDGSNGNIVAAGNITASSDERLKDNFEEITSAIDKVKQIRGLTFTRVDMDHEKRFAGVIAQEVEKVLPEVVSEDSNGYKAVAYGNMVGLLIEAIKEQQKQIEELKAALLNK